MHPAGLHVSFNEGKARELRGKITCQHWKIEPTLCPCFSTCATPPHPTPPVMPLQVPKHASYCRLLALCSGVPHVDAVLEQLQALQPEDVSDLATKVGVSRRSGLVFDGVLVDTMPWWRRVTAAVLCHTTSPSCLLARC